MPSGCTWCSLSSAGSSYTDRDPQSCHSLGLSSLVTVMLTVVSQDADTAGCGVWSVECGGPAAQLTDNRTARLSAAGVTTAPAPAAMRGVGHHPPPLPAADTGYSRYTGEGQHLIDTLLSCCTTPPPAQQPAPAHISTLNTAPGAG